MGVGRGGGGRQGALRKVNSPSLRLNSCMPFNIPYRKVVV